MTGSAFWTLYTDGASRGNPGLSGAGWVLYDPEGRLVHQDHAFLGTKTNNEAEYEAVILGLEAACALNAKQVLLRADSELLIKQLNGIYKVRNPRMARLFQLAQQQIRRLDGFRAEHVRRHLNAEADQQANLAIDSRQGVQP